MAEFGEMGKEALKELLNVKRTRACPVARQMMAKELIESSGIGVAQRHRMACERRALEVQKMAQNLKNGGDYGKINARKGGTSFPLFFPYVFPYAPETKENSTARIEPKQSSNSCLKREIAQDKGQKISGKRSHVKFKSLLLRQAKSLEPQWFQAFSFVSPLAKQVPLHIDKDPGLLT